MYLFFDELQRIEAWEDAINAFRVDFDCDIYVTGSNAYLLSSEYSTYLSGRCVEIKMLPLSFRDVPRIFIGFEVRETQSALGGLRKQVFDKNSERYELREVFDAYMRFGGMPGIADVGLEQEKALSLLDGIYSTVVFATFWNGKSAEVKSRSQTLRCCARSFCFLRIISAPVFLLLHRQHTGQRRTSGRWQTQRRTQCPYRPGICECATGELLLLRDQALLTSREKPISARSESIISSTSDFAIICWVSAIVTAVMPLRMSFTLNCFAAAMM